MSTQNQLRIINGVLTLSKLDSNGTWISVEPVDAQIHHCISETLKIFHYERQFKCITAYFKIEPFYDANSRLNAILDSNGMSISVESVNARIHHWISERR